MEKGSIRVLAGGFLAGVILVSLFVSCGQKTPQTQKGAEFVEDYISQLKEIEIPAHSKWNGFMRLLENMPESPGEETLIEVRDAVSETMEANRTAVEEFRALASKPRPTFIDDSVHIFLRVATAFLGQSYEMRNEALTWFNRYISLGTSRFFEEYTEKMSLAMEHSRQAFFFLTMARVRQRISTGDTLDMTISEFLNIPEIPEMPEFAVPQTQDEAEVLISPDT